MTDAELEAVENFFEGLKFKFKVTSFERRVSSIYGITSRVDAMIYTDDGVITGEVTFKFNGAGIPLAGNALPAPKE